MQTGKGYPLVVYLGKAKSSEKSPQTVCLTKLYLHLNTEIHCTARKEKHKFNELALLAVLPKYPPLPNLIYFQKDFLEGLL